MIDTSKNVDLLSPTDRFVERHVGPDTREVEAMLSRVGFESLDALVEATVPSAIYRSAALDLPAPQTERAMVAEAAEIAAMNVVKRSLIGMGYHRAVLPGVIQRNILENPAWYTQYTPYQPEISQGRLEALLNYQTMICDLTGLPVANASLLDEGTAAAEAMSLCYGALRGKRNTIVVSGDCHPQSVAVIQTRALPLGINVEVSAHDDLALHDDVFAVVLQYPGSDGVIREDMAAVIEQIHGVGALAIVAADLLALTMLKSPGELGADVAIGTTQRFGVPMGFGGPHAAYFAARDKFKRKIPGRLVGVSKGANGEQALRLALQTREQHIRRDKATSNICTSQVLLAVIASMYAVYHGPEGLLAIARRVKLFTEMFATALADAGIGGADAQRFDTVSFAVKDTKAVLGRIDAAGFELRQLADGRLGVTFDEAITVAEFEALVTAVTGQACSSVEALAARVSVEFGEGLARTSDYLTHPTFHAYHAEHELLRYMYRLQQRDLSLTTSMIPLGSCTMKLNATAEMLPVTMAGFSELHPFTDPVNTNGYRRLFTQLEAMLGEITGLPGVSLQPNAGSQGEYAGLLTVRAYHEANGDAHRNICLIPSSAHGTNPASAVMAGMKVVVVKCDERGNVDLVDLREKASKHSDNLAAVMVTYPSTHGVFEEGIVELCSIIHEHGGQVYMDGANMNAQVGICRPGDFGADVLHLNLHKTFCIPHGGGGPGVGPIAVAAHLAPFLPGHSEITTGGEAAIGPVSAAPWGSASILPISWMYIRMMGAAGLREATQVAILNANYLAKRLGEHYDLLYTGENGTVAHEFILDLRPLADSAGVSVADVAKRLMDYGFHAPTMSWPVAGALMVEPTESETLYELDRFADALISIRAEIAKIEAGEWPREDNPLVNAPHTAATLTGEWSHPYERDTAVFPSASSRASKFWPSVGRLDDAFGDRNLVCSCPSIEEYED